MGAVISFRRGTSRGRSAPRRPHTHRNRRVSAFLPLVLLIAGSAIAALLVTLEARPPGLLVSEDFAVCRGKRQPSCVLDGDTIRYRGERIRLLGIDTPEIFSPECASERERGLRATSRLVELVNEGPFEVVAGFGRDRDVYGRQLRLLVREGRSLGDVLVDEGLARRWNGRRGGWCG